MGSDLDRLERQVSEKTFNMGDYAVRITEGQVEVRSKKGKEWGQAVLFQRASVKASFTPVSRKPLIVLWVGYLFYALGFLTLFVVDGIPQSDQVAVLGIALSLLLVPLLLYIFLPTTIFVAGCAVFFVAIFSAPELGYMGTLFQAAQEAIGGGYVEAFIIGASLFPIVLHVMVGQTIVKYRLLLEEGPNRFEGMAYGSSRSALLRHIAEGPPEMGQGFSLRRLFEFRLPFFFMRLSRGRMKSCQYCGEKTLLECTRCRAPICSSHYGTLQGYKVCLDCLAQRRGKTREGLRWMNR